MGVNALLFIYSAAFKRATLFSHVGAGVGTLFAQLRWERTNFL